MADRAANVVLRDGSTVHVRPVGSKDRQAVRALFEGLSDTSRWLRFFSAFPNLDSVLTWATEVDGEQRYALVATTGPSREVVAHAGYEREAADPERAEVALAIADRFQGKGVGTILLGQLAEVAGAAGVTTFTAEVLPENHKMIDVFRASGFPVTLRSVPGAVLVELPTSLSPEAMDRYERREQLAAVAGVQRILAPRSVAVVGASRRRGTVGGELFHNLLEGGFNGPVYPVNPSADVVQSVVAYRSLADIPGPVDLAVVTVPGDSVIAAARDCAVKGVRGVVVISAGFSETGPEGAARQRELVGICRDAGMRLVGPNCLGVLNTDATISMDATFGPTFPRRGGIGFLSQSGALGLAVIAYAETLGIGLSSFVSVGNKADISSNDLLNYWEQDPLTKLVLLYIESFGNPRKFARIARTLARSKPVIAVKSGRSAAGARATSSHTDALLAQSDVTVDTLFRQSGVIRTNTLAELFDVAALLVNQPHPAGSRVGIVTNAGGPGILCADACAAGGLDVVSLSVELRARLAEFLPAEAALSNPVDMLASAPAASYRRAVERLTASGEVDAVVAIFIRPLVTEQAEVATAIEEAAEGAGTVPVLAVLMSPGGPPPELAAGERRVPWYTFPEDAAGALVHAVQYGAWRSSPQGRVPNLEGIDTNRAAALLASALGSDAPATRAAEAAPGSQAPAAAGERHDRWLPPDQVVQLLESYGVPVVDWRIAATPEAAGEAASELGGAVALKVIAPGLVHKSDVGGVRLGLVGAMAVTEAAREITRNVSARGNAVEGFLVQPIVTGGIAELLIGVVHDASFGPVIACGAGGTTVELLGDVAVRISPLTDVDATDMLRSLKTFPLLNGYRGASPGDVSAVEDALLRISALVDAHPEVAELDCNPVIVLEKGQGVVVVDARIRIEEPPPPIPMGARLA